MPEFGINQPNITGSYGFQTYIKNLNARSGRRLPPSFLDQVIGAELDRASANMYRNREANRADEALKLQAARDAESSRQFGISQEDAKRIAEINAKTGLAQSVLQTGATAGLAYALWPKTPAPAPGGIGGQIGTGTVGGETPIYLQGANVTPEALEAGRTAVNTGPTLMNAGVPPVEPVSPSVVATGKTLAPGAGSAVGVAGKKTVLDVAEAMAGEGGTGAGAGAGAGIGISDVALPIALYQGTRMAGKYAGGGVLGDVLKDPLTGALSYGVGKTGIKELKQAGNLLKDVERTVIQQPLDMVGDLASNVWSGISGWL